MVERARGEEGEERGEGGPAGQQPDHRAVGASMASTEAKPAHDTQCPAVHRSHTTHSSSAVGTEPPGHRPWHVPRASSTT